jgi:hypothetical protein
MIVPMSRLPESPSCSLTIESLRRGGATWDRTKATNVPIVVDRRFADCAAIAVLGAEDAASIPTESPGSPS